VKIEFSLKGAAIQRIFERGVVGAVTRQLLVKTLRACALVNCKVWKLAMAL
jgi:hypothetical protein